MSILIGNDKGFPGTARAFLFSRFDFLQSVPSLLREKIFLVHQFDSVLLGKRFRAFAIYHHMSRFLHDQPREADRILHMLQNSDGSGGKRSPVHDGCIHFVCAGACKH